MQFKFTNVTNYKVRYAESGNSMKNVLFIHGLGGSAESWKHNTDEFARYFHVFAPDLIGFGHSDKPKIRYTMGNFIDFLSAFMDVVGIKSADVIGSSMGGQIAAEFVIKHKDRVEKLVLVSPAGVPPREFKGTRELKQYMGIFKAKNVDDVRKALTPVDADQSTVSEDYVRNVYAYVKMDGAERAFMSSLKESAAAPRLVKRLRRIKAKTLVVWGKDDRLIPVKYCVPFLAMQNCRMVLLEGVGHRPHFERPALFNRTVIDFLNG
jgi:pimeloyl-ACP methyl ester carboxylesterase